jgi:hypothetical protein
MVCYLVKHSDFTFISKALQLHSKRVIDGTCLKLLAVDIFELLQRFAATMEYSFNLNLMLTERTTHSELFFITVNIN